jgi:hypothetical protein
MYPWVMLRPLAVPGILLPPPYELRKQLLSSLCYTHLPAYMATPRSYRFSTVLVPWLRGKRSYSHHLSKLNSG